MFLQVIEHIGAGLVLENPRINQRALRDGRISQQRDIFKVGILRFRSSDPLGPTLGQALTLSVSASGLLLLRTFRFPGRNLLIRRPLT